MIKTIDGNICAPKGFLASGVYAGIKKKANKLDLALIYSKVPATASGVFTTSQAKAAPVILTEQNIKKGNKLQAIVVNSGNANACTGKLGMVHAKQMSKTVAKELKLDPQTIAVSSTGVIGVNLPIKKVVDGITTAISQLAIDDKEAAQAIMTTDTFAKSIAIEIDIGGKPVRIGAIAKGSGMIHPNMATMLSFITTDAEISQSALQQAIANASQTSFNMITVDGDCSTNDMVVILANGLAKNNEITSIDDTNWRSFYKGLLFVCMHLAKLIVKDGEGATKLIETKVYGAATIEQAQLAARAICRSPLVKTAMFGEDANWGRIASAVGASGAEIDLNKLSIEIGGLVLFKDGMPIPFEESKAKKILKKKLLVIKVKLGKGAAKAVGWGCDLTYDYVKINASYRS